MTDHYNRFEGGTNGSAVSTSNSGGASGTAFDYIIVNGASTPAGNASYFAYATAAALNGSMGCSAPAQSGTNYVRWQESSGGSRGVQRVPIKIATGITAGTTFTVCQIRSASTGMGGITIRGTGTAFQIGAQNRLGADVSASRFTATPGTQYWAEVAATKGTGTADGTLALKVYAADGTTELWSWTSSVEDTGTANVDQARFMGNSLVAMAFDDLRFDGNLASGWLGPIATNVAPTCTLTASETADVEPGKLITLTATTTDSDGTSSITSLVQIDGTPTVPLTNIGGDQWTFIAPATLAGDSYTFRATATDDDSATTTADVTVSILPASIRIGGDTPAIIITG